MLFRDIIEPGTKFAALKPNRTDKYRRMVSPARGLSTGRRPSAADDPGSAICVAVFYASEQLAPTNANVDVMTEALFTRYRDMMLAPGVRQTKSLIG